MLHPEGVTHKRRDGLGGTKYVLVGVSETLTKLDDLVERFPRAVPALVRSVTEDAARFARANAPRRSGALIEAIKTAYFDGQWVGAVFVEPVQERDVSRWKEGKAARINAKVKPGAWYAAQKRPSKFPVWIEWGTRRSQPHAFLLPAGERAYNRMQAELPQMIERFVKEAE